MTHIVFLFHVRGEADSETRNIKNLNEEELLASFVLLLFRR